MNDEVKSWIRIYEFIPPKIGNNNQEYLDNIFSENSKDITLNILKTNNKKTLNIGMKKNIVLYYL